MGLKRNNRYNSYTIAFKLNAVRLSNRKNVKAVDVAESLGIHPVMLYRWRKDYKDGLLSGNNHPIKLHNQTEPNSNTVDSLQIAEKRIKELEILLTVKDAEILTFKSINSPRDEVRFY